MPCATEISHQSHQIHIVIASLLGGSKPAYRKKLVEKKKKYHQSHLILELIFFSLTIDHSLGVFVMRLTR